MQNMRISFTGEHSYEINIPASYGKSLWEKCMEAGKEYNITPYGTETMHLLRAEKGFNRRSRYRCNTYSYRSSNGLDC